MRNNWSFFLNKLFTKSLTCTSFSRLRRLNYTIFQQINYPANTETYHKLLLNSITYLYNIDSSIKYSLDLLWMEKCTKIRIGIKSKIKSRALHIFYEQIIEWHLTCLQAILPLVLSHWIQIFNFQWNDGK